MEKNNDYFTTTGQAENLGEVSQNEMLAIIGLGKMGSAFVEGLTSQAAFSEYKIQLSNGTKERTEAKLAGKIFTENVAIAENNLDAIAQSHMIFIALKPGLVCEEIEAWRDGGVLTSDKIIVSIAAGVTLNSMKESAGDSHQPVARIMPNTAAAEGNGVFGWTVSDDVTIGDAKTLKTICETLGLGVFVDGDDGIDKITGISGSGIAYFFEMGYQLQKEAEELGFSHDTAQKIARQTLFGAAMRAMNSEEDFEILRNQVVSPNGTTAAALRVFQEYNFGAMMNGVVHAARNRASELGREYAKNDRL